MSTHTPEWFARRGITLTPAGELVVIAGAATLAIAWVTLIILAAVTITGAAGGGGL